MNKRYSKSVLLLTLIFTALAAIIPLLPALQAADFQLSNPGIELRRLQICEQCSEPLVVTSIAPGAAVRCPKCQRVQRRLPDSELQVKVYQICPSCSQRLDVSGLKPHEAFRCGACGFEQRVLPEAVYLSPSTAGTGRIPAEKTISPSARILPEAERQIPEAIVPGLNAPEGALESDFELELKLDNSSDTPRTPDNSDTPTSQDTNDSSSEEPPRDTSGAFLDLPEIDNDIEGNISILVNAEPLYESTIMRRIVAKIEQHQSERGTPITATEKVRLYQSMRQEAEKELIDEVLIRQEAIRDGIIPATTTEELPLSQFRDQLLTRHTPAPYTPSTAELQQYYRDHRADYAYPNNYILDAIVIFNDRSGKRDSRSSSIIANEIKARLNKGVDFTLLATRYSEGPFHKEGGRIRRVQSQYISENFLIRPLRRAGRSLQSGEMFGPISLPSCKLFIQIAEEKPGRVKAFATVRKEIEESLTRQSREEAFNQWLASIRKAAVIEYKK